MATGAIIGKMESKGKLLQDVMSALQRQDYRQAVGLLRKAVQSDPQDVSLVIQLGDVLFKLGEMDEASRQYLDAAHIYYKAGFKDKMKIVLQKVQTPNVTRILGKVTDQAFLSEVRDHLRLDSGSAPLSRTPPWVEAEIFLSQGLRQEAIRALETCLESPPSEPDVLRRIQKLCHELGVDAGDRLKAG